MKPPKLPTSDLGMLQTEWLAVWPSALAAWSKFTRLRPPRLCVTDLEAKNEGLAGSFAMIRLQDQAIVVSLPRVASCHVERFALEILAHEIGHHVLAPATLVEHGRMIARMRWALPTVEKHAPMVANLYTDLLINDRLQRSAQLRMADVYRTLAVAGEGGAVWALYTRIYEILWSLERGSLGGGKTDDRSEGDAVLGARLVRNYATDWLDGSGRFAALLLPHLMEDAKSARIFEKWLDTQAAGAGGDLTGLVEAETGEREGAVHPAQDASLSDLLDGAEPSEDGNALPIDTPQNLPGRGQAREPFQFGEILRAMGIQIADHEAAVRYYRERARPYLIPFPSQPTPVGTEPLPEGLEPWQIGDAFDMADWFQSVLQSPRVVPGLTTVQRVWGISESQEPKRQPLDLDLYVDSSGSMPNPQRYTSFPALAGAILGISALRAGARVQATLWSGKRQFVSTPGFVRDVDSVLRVLTGYFGGATAFPIHILRETYGARKGDARPTHILVISDDGISTMFDADERGKSGWEVAAMALRKAAGGGTLVLNLPSTWEAQQGPCAAIRRARNEQGWTVCRVASLEDLVEFARNFSHLRYGPSSGAQR